SARAAEIRCALALSAEEAVSSSVLTGARIRALGIFAGGVLVTTVNLQRALVDVDAGVSLDAEADVAHALSYLESLDAGTVFGAGEFITACDPFWKNRREFSEGEVRTLGTARAAAS